MADEAKTVTGGTTAAKVEIVPPESTVEKGTGETIPVVTTAPGAMPVTGIVPVGTKIPEMPLTAYSEAWMRPANAAAGKKLKDWQAKSGAV